MVTCNKLGLPSNLILSHPLVLPFTPRRWIIAAMLAEASDKVSEHSGFVCDERTGMYYDQS